jgi:hypothetical protein
MNVKRSVSVSAYELTHGGGYKIHGLMWKPERED